MTSKEYTKFDFRDIAGLDDTASVMRDWIGKSSSFFGDFWKAVSDFGVQLTLGSVTTSAYKEMTEDVPREYYCCKIQLTENLANQWWMSPQDLRNVAWEMLGLTPPEQMRVEESADSGGEATEAASQDEEEDSEEEGALDDQPGILSLSPVEIALTELLLQHVASSLTDGWMGAAEINLQVDPLDRDPKKTRLFRAKDLVSRVAINLEYKHGKSVINWISPKQELTELLDSFRDPRSEDAKLPHRPDPKIVGQSQYDIVTVLGEAMIPLKDITKLNVGQMIVLDQRIDSPIDASVNGRPAFQCWPGRIGNMQALEIESCLEM